MIHKKIVAALVILLLALSSCAAWKADTVAGYESTGSVLTDIESRAKAMCDAGQLKPADCQKLKSAYNRARAAYITSGDALVLAIDTQDAAAKQKSLAAYQQAVYDLGALLPELITAADQLGIKPTPYPSQEGNSKVSSQEGTNGGAK